MAVRLHRRVDKSRRPPPSVRFITRLGFFGNPFHILNGSNEARREAKQQFEAWLEDDATPLWRFRRKRLLEKLPTLVGLDLACTCPLPAEGEEDLCHVEVLLRRLARMEGQAA